MYQDSAFLRTSSNKFVIENWLHQFLHTECKETIFGIYFVPVDFKRIEAQERKETNHVNVQQTIHERIIPWAQCKLPNQKGSTIWHDEGMRKDRLPQKYTCMGFGQRFNIIIIIVIISQRKILTFMLSSEIQRFTLKIEFYLAL